MHAVNVQSVSIHKQSWNIIRWYTQTTDSFVVVYVVKISNTEKVLSNTLRHVPRNWDIPVVTFSLSLSFTTIFFCDYSGLCLFLSIITYPSLITETLQYLCVLTRFKLLKFIQARTLNVSSVEWSVFSLFFTAPHTPHAMHAERDIVLPVFPSVRCQYWV